MFVHKRQYASMKIYTEIITDLCYDKFCLIESESNKIAFRSNLRTDAWIFGQMSTIEYNRSYLYIDKLFFYVEVNFVSAV